MADDLSVSQLGALANRTLEQLSGLSASAGLDDARRLVERLRNAREYGAMGQLAEAVSRIDPKDVKNRRLYAQALIETGKATVAIDVLQALSRRLPKDHPEFAEATGLIGRAHKQIFFDARDKTSAAAREALKQAIAAYRKPFESDPANTWHGVNLLALIANSRRLGVRVAPNLNPADVARQVVASLEAIPAEQRNEWYLPTLAEACLGLDDWDAVERHVSAYAAALDAKAFLLASTLRQFTKIWNIEELDRGRGLASILRARLMQLPGGELQLQSDELERLRHVKPDPVQLEAVLGSRGAETYEWWKTGLTRARSVVAIRRRLGSRVGTGFLLRAAELGLEPGQELVVLTNFHVVNEHGVTPGIKPQEAEVVFEAVPSAPRHEVASILWSSPPEQCDACILRLSIPVTDIDPLPVSTSLPDAGSTPAAQVYIIGHPGGRDLAFSFQDNELLDHEAPPRGLPQIAGVCRVHYRAPTEGGSSGSPVFNASGWDVIALHHKGGKIGMPRLNGVTGTYAANEGISIRSIAEMPKK